ncbi:hypothetical protein EGT67_15895 [Prescottella agglutinans]|uniref:SMI1/KNR4 family protein n=1 Tax=Prescottella agglutinans TaxID=1644129 RepID=A0A438BC33_9NOCA|nr:hypothetical protein [Prescottella agglutinans]RVW08411.1 hypothetical protein EGT67_15895 [Prescottella agglutinans]
MDVFARAVAALRSAGWVHEPAPRGARPVPDVLASFPDVQQTWASSFSRLSSPDDAVWFLALDDYTDSADAAFAWNEFETLGREAAVSDDDAAAVAEFWRRHCPILCSVRGDYSYLAIGVDGAIVHGVEPEFEATTAVADSLDALLEAVARGSDLHPVVDALLFPARAGGAQN